MKWFEEISTFDGIFKSYWIETSLETLKSIISEDVKSVFQNILTFAGDKDYRHIIPELITALTYKKGKWSHGSIWHFLILSGYLSYGRKPGTIEAYAFISNEEIRYHWLSEMKIFMIDLFDSLYLNSLREASIEFRSKKEAIIFEFKKSKYEKYLDRDAESGLEQILSKHYSAVFPSECKILAIGVAFFSKQMSVLKWRILSEYEELRDQRAAIL